MEVVKDIIKNRNYPFVSQVKALSVINVFKKIIRECDGLKEFAPSVEPKFYKGGVLFVSSAHPAIAHKIDLAKKELIEKLNKELGSGLRVKEIFHLSM